MTAVSPSPSANAANAQRFVALLKGEDDSPAAEHVALNAGAAVFRTWCAQCHGSGAAGAKGYPNLLDNDWLWGGSIEDIHATISHGIRNETDDDARYSEMPKFGEILETAEIGQLAQYVLALSGQQHDAAAAAEGADAAPFEGVEIGGGIRSRRCFA